MTKTEKCNNCGKRYKVLEISNDDTWKDCIICGGKITQVRKALFTCLKCNQEYIADEQDMRPEIKEPFRIFKH